MQYLDFLGRMHEVLEPPTYLEIGIRHGDSLALARAPSVGIDPSFRLRTAIPKQTALYRETSDEYFDRVDPLAPFGGQPIALGFIDGMHLVEYALRDFANVERYAAWTSVVVFDDIFPRDVEMAARRRRTRLWTGDVYKMLAILTRHRPDLICLRVDTRPTGLLLVIGLDPRNQVLDERYNAILLDYVRPDPQQIPSHILERREAIAPEALLSASFWSILRDARDQGAPRGRGLRQLRRKMGRELGPAVTRARARRRRELAL